MKNTFNIALALTLLAGTGTAFAQPRNDYNRNAPPVVTQHTDTRNNDRQDQNNFGRDNHPAVTHAQDNERDNHRTMPAMNMRGPGHPDWRAGGHIARNDWRRGEVINYRDHHLRRPPRGYEWRQVDNNYVLAALTTGLIASIILANH